MQTASNNVVARERELVVIDGLIRRAAVSGGSLAIQGPAGIGKTVLFDACVATAARAGTSVLTSRPAEAESALPYAGLGDLLAPRHSEVAGKLAEPLRRALDVALLRQVAPAGGQHRLAVAIAVRDSLLALAEAGPILLAIDDLQWLDPESAFALGYALRRTAGERVGVVVAVRVAAGGSTAALEPLLVAPVVEVTLTSLDAGALGVVLRRQTGTTYLPHTLERIHSASEGNPFHALEIAHALELRDVPLAPDEPLPVPLTLRGLLQERMRRLSPSAARTLLAAAAMARPKVSTLRAALGDVVDGDLAEAQQEGIVGTRGDVVAFSHPLFAGAAYDAAPPADRRAVHGRLAAALSDEFEHVRHRALSVAGPDETVAALAAGAAEAAAHRGAVGVAATLAREAVRLTPAGDVQGLAARMILAAEVHDRAGANSPSDELLGLLEQPLDDATRMRVLRSLTYSYGNNVVAIAPLIDEITSLIPRLDDARAAEAHLTVGYHAWNDSLPRAISHTRSGLEKATAADAPDLVARARYGLAQLLLAMGSPEGSSAVAAAQSAAADGGADLDVGERAILPGWHAMWNDHISEARSIFTAAARSAEERGAYGELSIVLVHLTEADIRAGDLTAALDHAERARDLALGDVGEQPWSRYLVGCCLAHLGRSDDARHELAAGVEISRQYGDVIFLAQNLVSLGFLEVSAGNFEAASANHRELRTLNERLGLHHPGVLRWHGDAIDAMVATGNLDAASNLCTELTESAATLDLNGSLAIAARGEGLIAAARGDVESAVDAFTRAIALHDLVEAPVDRARTSLLLGAAHRRLRHHAAARSALEDATHALDAMGLALWSARAHEELARIGGRVAKPGGLSPTEIQVGRLAADGKTNREIAAELFISVKTVEANLSSIYRKLDIRSRTQLARWVAAGAGEPRPTAQ